MLKKSRNCGFRVTIGIFASKCYNPCLINIVVVLLYYHVCGFFRGSLTGDIAMLAVALTLQEMSGLEITILFIILSTFVGLIFKRIHRDKCLKDFNSQMVTLEDMDGKSIWGKLRIESTGLELVYRDKRDDAKGHIESSYILYKFEYPKIQALIRFHDYLSDSDKDIRQKDIEQTYHPKFMRRMWRKVLNGFKTVRDAFAEVVNLLISKAKKSGSVGSTLTSQDKYVSQIKQDLMGSVGTSYEPLLERYVGSRVVLELVKSGKIVEYSGVLKDYTAEFIEVMDVDYNIGQSEEKRKADLVVLRKYGMIRHLGE